MGRRKLIAFDNSALQRLWDAANSLQVLHQASAVREILARIAAGEHQFLLTRTLLWEIQQTPDTERRSLALESLPEHSGYATEHDGIAGAVTEFFNAGLGYQDAMHVALAWDGRADVLFTTDSGILRFHRLHRGKTPGLRIADPINWKEVL